MAADIGTDHGQRIGVQEFYKGRKIFMTGATGFLGHVMLDKLLRTCSDLDSIYVLMREKKGVDPLKRFNELFDNKIFSKMKEICPNYMDKVKSINGDCLKPNLGMDAKDEELLVNEVQVVFHIAATVNFDAPLKYAANMNIRCTSDLIDIAHRMKRLDAFVYISTAFSNCAGRTVVEEKFYDVPISAENLLTITEILDDKTVDEITPSLLGHQPNTYVFTKVISEDMFRRKSSGIPLVIFRPAIVVSTAKEPVSGWVNNLYGPTGLVAGGILGIIRSVHANGSCIANIVPCDYVINAVIVSAWDIALQRSVSEPVTMNCVHRTNNNGSITGNSVSYKQTVPIYNFSNYRNSVTWENYMKNHQKLELEIPTMLSLWIHSFELNKYKIVHRTYCIFLHWLPALIIDGACKILRKEAKLWDSYKRIHKLLDALSYFSVREWKMVDDNVKTLLNKLSPEDKKLYNFDMEELDWTSYCDTSCRGIRQYIINDPPETIPMAIKRRKKMLIIHYLCLTLITIIIFYLMFKLTKFA